MKAVILSLVTIAALTGCSSSSTYQTEGSLPAGEPSTNIIVSSDNGSSSGLTYTNVGDSGILVECGDGDGDCSINVYQATELEEIIPST